MHGVGRRCLDVQSFQVAPRPVPDLSGGMCFSELPWGLEKLKRRGEVMEELRGLVSTHVWPACVLLRYERHHQLSHWAARRFIQLSCTYDMFQGTGALDRLGAFRMLCRLSKSWRSSRITRVCYGSRIRAGEHPSCSAPGRTVHQRQVPTRQGRWPYRHAKGSTLQSG